MSRISTFLFFLASLQKCSYTDMLFFCSLFDFLCDIDILYKCRLKLLAVVQIVDSVNSFDWSDSEKGVIDLRGMKEVHVSAETV